MYKKIFKSIQESSALQKVFDGLWKSEDNAVLARKPHFIFSAENPMYPENHVYNLKHEEVVSLLKKKGYQVEEVKGHYGGHPERSIIVHNTTKHAVRHLHNLAKKLGQESSIASDGYNHEMHMHGGPNAGLHFKGQGTAIHKRKPDDYYTQMNDGTTFSHHFNFDEAHEKHSSAFAPEKLSTKKSEVDFIKSEPNHPMIGAGPHTKLIHFSPTSGLKTIDPHYQGNRIKDASSKRGKPMHPVSFFYMEGAKPEALVTNGSVSKYVARLGHSKIYDLGTDPDGIRHQLHEAAKNRQVNPGTFTRDELDEAIKAKGYHGIYNSAHESEDMRKVVGMYHKVDVEKEHPFHPRDAELATDQAYEQHHSITKNEDEEFEAKLARIDHIRKTTKPRKMKLPLEHIHQDPHGVANAHKTFHFTPDFKVSAKPVRVGMHTKTGKLYLLDGYHRALAAQKNGQSHIEAEVIPTKGVLGAKHPQYKSPRYKTYHDQFFHEPATWDEVKEPKQRTKLQKSVRRTFESEITKAEAPAMPAQPKTPAAPAEPQHNEQVRQVADSYAQSRGLKLNHNIPKPKVDEKHAKKIADAYHTAQHSPNDPHVKTAYEALINETKDQYKHMLANGLKVSKIQPGQANPYKTSKDLFHDVKHNNHIAYFPTDQGFGSGDQTNDHPMLQPTEHLDAEGKPMAANDIFRIVHDYFGHAKEGHTFGPHGEEGAWQHHMQMYSPMAQKALTAETRGQNSWVNYGPHGENNRKNPANTTYADQKATILPDFAHQHGEQSIYASLKKREVIMMKGAMKRLAPYNPDKHISADDHRATENWTSEGDDQEARSKVPEMHVNAKTRALHKIGAHTEVRRHPETGERMFLLHRGMGEGEYKLNHKGSVSNYAPGTMTSWTPHYKVAVGFGNDHLEGAKPKVASAWIPESEIHNIPNQTMIPDENTQFRNEHEVIVNHRTPHPHAHKDLVIKARRPRMFLDSKINIKGEVERAKKDPKGWEQMHGDKVKRTIRAEEYKRSKFGKREAIATKTLMKGDISNKIKSGIAGVALAASAALSPVETAPKHIDQPPPQVQQQVVQTPVNKRKERILNSIKDVESSGGTRTNHAAPSQPIHSGERAYGSYGLMPLTIRETIKANPAFKPHAEVMKLKGDQLHAYMNKNPDLERQIAEAHYDRLSKQFGDNPDKIGYAWLNGVKGTWRAIKEKRPLKNHWHVKKILRAYDKHKKGEK